MTREQAKECLSGFRAHGADADDPAFREALELVKKDSELAIWFARQREFDTVLAEKFSSIQPPEGLEKSILESLDRPTPLVQPARLIWLALAAAVIAAALVLTHQSGLFRPTSDRFREFRSEVLAMVSVQPAPQLDLQTASLDTVDAFLDTRKATRLGAIPQRLRGMPTAGCKVFVWHDHRASLTCFSLPSGKLLHLVAIPESAFEGSAMPSGGYSENGWQIMFQERDGLVLMWASQAPMEEVKQLVEI
jgi:hypothetical protein